MMKSLCFSLFFGFFLMTTVLHAEETAYPGYLLKARSQVQKAVSAGAEQSAFTDDVLIAQNFIRTAESEYTKNLTWTGKLEPAAESTVHYFASMAELQASVVLARAEKLRQENELTKIEIQIAAVKSKIKVFDDKNEEISALKKAITELNGELLTAKADKEQLASKIAVLEGNLSSVSATLKTSQQKGTTLGTEAERCTVSLVMAEKRTADLTAELEKHRADSDAAMKKSADEIARLNGEVSSLAAAKGLSESQSKERIEALNRQKEFVSKVAQLGGIVKPGSDNKTVVFNRSKLLKSPKNDQLTAEGQTLVSTISALLTNYSEYRIKLKVHGYGTPTRNEDASATDRMARMLRSSILETGKFDSSRIEALGVGSAEPAFSKKHVEENRRVELLFVNQ